MGVYNLYYEKKPCNDGGIPYCKVMFILTKTTPKQGKRFKSIEDVVRHAKQEGMDVNPEPAIDQRWNKKDYQIELINYIDAEKLNLYMNMSKKAFKEATKSKQTKKTSWKVKAEEESSEKYKK